MDRPQTRRMFLSQLGRGTFAIAVLGVTAAACSDDAGGDPFTPRVTDAAAGETTSSTAAAPATTTTSGVDTSATTTTAGAGTATAGEAVTWERVSLGFVSAYVLARGGEAAVVDTGVSGSASDIATALGVLGLAWDAVGHVILTHSHGDHIGSLGEVLTQAAAAEGYAGAADIPQITSPRELVPVADGDIVFGLQIVATPGHTPGHISVFDPHGRVLVAGDALNGSDAVGGEPGGIAGANPQFTADLVAADDSVRKLARLDVDTILFGHGTPVVGGAGDALVELASSI
jgi:glyoxylase-like metal-dependent hydrolase (beta-lactamase superfamily II)